jgi:hypothetical protein
MSWKDSLKKYRTNVSGSGMVPLDNVLKDHEELGLKIRGLMGAVGSLRNNMPRSVSKVMDKLDVIKEEMYKTEQLLVAMNESYSFETKYDWEKTMEDLE